MTTTSLSKREWFLKLRGNRTLDPFIDSPDIFKTPFFFGPPSMNGNIYKLYVRPMADSHSSACYIEDIPIVRGELIHILAPQGWSIVGLAYCPADKSRYALPFKELA